MPPLDRPIGVSLENSSDCCLMSTVGGTTSRQVTLTYIRKQEKWASKQCSIFSSWLHDELWALRLSRPFSAQIAFGHSVYHNKRKKARTEIGTRCFMLLLLSIVDRFWSLGLEKPFTTQKLVGSYWRMEDKDAEKCRYWKSAIRSIRGK